MVPLSILDLSPIVQGGTAGQALRNSRDLAQHAEKWGYRRFWLAEHHNMPGVASAATAVAIGFVAEATKLGELYVDFAKEAYKPFESAYAKIK